MNWEQRADRALTALESLARDIAILVEALTRGSVEIIKTTIDDEPS